MRDIIKPAVTLFVICVVVAFALAVTYSETKSAIADRELQQAEAARKEVLPLADSFKRLENIEELTGTKPELKNVKEVYMGMKGSTVEGYVVAVEPKGYGGTIQIAVGIDTAGKISGIKIGQNNETPGLGSKAAEPAFKSQFAGIATKEPLKVVKGKKSKPEEIEAISGATITSKAVTGAAQAAVDAASEVMKKEGVKK